MNVESLKPGSYRVSLYDGESSLSVQFRKSEQLQLFSIISTQPKVTLDLFSIECYSPDDGDIDIEVVDSSGKVVYEETNNSIEKGRNILVLNLGQFNGGKYTILLKKGSDRLETDVTVEKLQIN